MADVVKPVTRYEYFVITTEKFPSYEEKIKYKRYLRRSVETPTLASGEEMVKVAITTYPNNTPYELNTDPINLSGWDPLESTNPDVYKTWASCQDWLFYDEVNARNYVDPEGLVNDAKIGGFMKLEPTYFYYDSENKYQGSGTWNKRGENTAILTPPLVDGEIADPNKYDITWNGTDAWVIVKFPEKIIGYPEFTFVVDSNDRLREWATNSHTDGQDYTSILIRKGTFEYSATTGIDLTSTNTKCIVGEAGSKIIINKTTSGTGTGIGYSVLPATDDYFITNLTLEYNATSGRGVRNARNLTNCNVTSTGSSGSVAVTGIEDCYNVTKCSSNGLSTGSYGYGFRNCSNMYGCSGYGEGTTLGTGIAHCNTVQNCRDTGSTPYYDSFFSTGADSTYACANTLEGGWNQ